MCGCSRSAGSRLRVALVDLLERQAAALLHQVDQAEVAGRQRDHVLLAELVAPARSCAASVPVASLTAWPTAASFSSPWAARGRPSRARSSARRARPGRSRCAA